MERDLRNIRKKRAERDQARDRANGIPSPGALAKEAEELAQQANASAFEDTAQGQVPGEGEEPLIDGNGDLIVKTDEDKVIGTGQGMPQDSSNSAGLAITMPSDPASAGQDQSQNENQQPADELNASDAMMDTSDPANVEFFESMFNDELASADDTLNFGDFAFSMDTTNNTNHPLNNSDNTLQTSSLPNVDLNNITSTSNEDINSLLPGLENYVTGSDFSNINMPATSSTQPDTNAQGTTTNTTTTLPTTAPAPDATTTADNSTLDDSFFDFNFDMTNNGGDDMGDGTLDDFDNFDWN